MQRGNKYQLEQGMHTHHHVQVMTMINVHGFTIGKVSEDNKPSSEDARL